MYGTIAKLRSKPGALEAIRVMEARRPAGFVASYVLQSDADPDELWFVVFFENKDFYEANAASPQQDSEYQILRSHLGEDPQWHDGMIIFDSSSRS
jgi:heme-degrading monooxygenase HmoA